MAGFKAHITTSTVLGFAYGGAGLYLLRDASGEVPVATCVLGAGLCSVAGMLPDLDSDTGIPLRETVAFTAAVVPMLLIDRFSHLGLSHESMVLAGALIYLLIRFGFFKLLMKFTVHRGMFHSLPAAVVSAELAFLLCSCEESSLRWFKAIAVFVGYTSHLLLDEFNSIQWTGGRWRLKKSFGTATKIWGTNTYANISTYAKVAILGFIAFRDPIWMEQLEAHVEEGKQIPKAAIEAIERIQR